MAETGGHAPFFRPLQWDEVPVTTATTTADGFQLPVGTVTLLLADIEGSVRFWESRGDAEVPAELTRYEETVAETIGRRGGVRPLDQGAGDSFVAAFARASDAVACAVDVQRALAADASPIKPRIALHTGEVQLREEANYVGRTINRCARIRDTAHGGQIVVSRSCHDLVVDRLPDGCSLRDLGPHRLRDLARPEQIYQLVHPELGDDFPPLRTLDTVPHNLPVQLTSFVGRRADIEDVTRLLDENRLVTLTGSGGCGKTRLALQVAAETLDDHAAGVWLVDLASVTETADVIKAVGKALGVREEPMRTLEQVVITDIADGRVLLVLDNCEQVVEGCAVVADALARACANLKVLATSREPLGVDGESVWRVPSLSLPNEDRIALIDAVTHSEAVQLFCERARKARPNFTLSEENAAAMADVCRRLEGIPLAIELAAARTRSLAPRQIADNLHDRFRLLAGGARTAVPRQQTLRASVDWSYDLLSERDRVLLRRVAVFAGGFTLDAAEQVCSDEKTIAELDVLDLLSSLVDRSLVLAEPDGEATRYRLLETIRQYAAERLAQSGDEDAVRTRHLDHYAAIAEGGGIDFVAPVPPAWIETIEREHDNVMGAFRWAQSRMDGAAMIRIAASMVRYWVPRAMASEAIACIDPSLEAADDADPLMRGAAMIGRIQSAPAWETQERAQRLLDFGRQTGLESLQAHALVRLGMLAAWTLGPDAGQAQIEEGIELARRSGNLLAEAVGLQALGSGLLHHGQVPAARIALERSIALARQSGDERLERYGSLTLSLVAFDHLDLQLAALEEMAEWARARKERFFLGQVKHWEAYGRLFAGDHDRARVCTDELAQLAAVESSPSKGQVLHLRAVLELAAGRIDEARRWADEAVSYFRRLGTLKVGLSFALSTLADVYLASAEPAEAKGHAEEALAVSAEVGGADYTMWACDVLARCHRALGSLEDAERVAHKALAIREGEFAIHAPTPAILENLAGLAIEAESWREATRLLAAAAAERERRGIRWGPGNSAPTVAADIVRLREALSAEDFTAAWTAGSAMSAEEAIAYARRGRGERKRPSHGWASLTPTEIEVTKLVREGLTNPQIAERLFVAPSTVKFHLSQIFAKLGVATRAELAAEATRRGL